MNKVAKEKQVKYEMDEESLKAKGHIILTKRHTVILVGKSWTLFYRPELKEDDKGKVSLTADSKNHYPNLRMVISDMLGDLVYHNAKVFGSDLKHLKTIMDKSFDDFKMLVDSLREPQEKPTEKKDKTPPIELPF